MMRRSPILIRRRVMIGVRATLLSGCLVASALAQTPTRQPTLQSIQIRDLTGVTVTLQQPPRRIISLMPSITETICLLDRCNALVGVDRWSNWPASVQSLPRVGDLDSVSLESVVALKPDLILVPRSMRLAERMRGLGLTVLVFEPEDWRTAQQTFLQIGLLLGLSSAHTKQRWQVIENQVSAIATQIPPQAKGIKVYYEVDSTPYAASESSFIGHLLQKLGMRNIVPGHLGSFPRLNPEFVVKADPQLMITSAARSKEFIQRPGWNTIEAARNSRNGGICGLTPTEQDAVVRPGPRMAEAAQALARCITEYANQYHP